MELGYGFLALIKVTWRGMVLDTEMVWVQGWQVKVPTQVSGGQSVEQQQQSPDEGRSKLELRTYNADTEHQLCSLSDGGSKHDLESRRWGTA